mgnify:CR=1 FL=1|tara:strand:+ start:296 stop:850 length:555 start_codon:yes stop_codon:yes gene_type:complete
MKKSLPIVFMLISVVAFAQNRYSKLTTATYQPLSSSEILIVPLTLQKQYNQNQKYLYDMKKWILELKPQISQEYALSRLNGEYQVLTSMEDEDLGRATKYLKQAENSIQEIISDYNIWVNQNNNKDGLLVAEKEEMIKKNPLNDSKNNAIDELKKLKELLDLGIITQEEFDKKAESLKKIILGN